MKTSPIGSSKSSPIASFLNRGETKAIVRDYGKHGYEAIAHLRDNWPDWYQEVYGLMPGNEDNELVTGALLSVLGMNGGFLRAEPWQP